MRPRLGFAATLLGTLGLLVTLNAGCASLSLFSDVHYHGTAEIDQRLDSLEQRMTALEASVHGSPTPAGPPNRPLMGFDQDR